MKWNVSRSRSCFGNKGFTLVELMVSMLCVTIIMGAVITWLLVGIRIETSAAENMERQNKTRVVMAMMESMASSGKVSTVQETGIAAVGAGGETLTDDAGTDWALINDSGKALVRYRAGSGTIVTGNGDVLMEDLEFASAEFVEDKSMLELVLRVNGQEYSNHIFCRTAVDSMKYGKAVLLDLIHEKTSENRLEFVELLMSQEGSFGEIKDPSQKDDEKEMMYYTKCYLNTTGNSGNWMKGWDYQTPWCGTFVSWALTHMNYSDHGHIERGDDIKLVCVPVFADVNDGRNMFAENYVFKSASDRSKFITRENIPSEKAGLWLDSESAYNNPKDIGAGDLIFFDWGEVGSSTGVIESGDGSLDHVGVVVHIDIENRQVFTVEGNSNGKVALRNYSLTDPAIVGYGILDWIEDGAVKPS